MAYTLHWKQFTSDTLEVLLRRQQLSLVKEIKEEAEKAKELGKGNGRGKGRGRGRGRGKATAEKKDGSSAGDDQKSPVAKSKRLVEATPERKQLFPDNPEAVPEPANLPAESPAKPVKPAQKRVRKAKTNSKDSAASAGHDVDMEQKVEKEGEGGGKLPEPEAVPKRSQPKKKAGPKDGEETGEAAGDGAEKAKLPGKALEKFAKEALEESARDPASWVHALKLFEAAKTTVKKGEFKQPYSYWVVQPYYTRGRVGLLQKNSGKLVHILSFGNEHCASIGVGIPLEAVHLYVGC